MPASRSSTSYPTGPRDAVAELFVSVVIPTRDEGPFIAAALDGLLAQDYPHDAYEILVVDGQSTDDTVSIVEQYCRRESRVRLLHNPRRLSSAARNVGVRAARGDVVIVVDGHCQMKSRRYVRDVADAFQRSGADCVGRPQPLDVTGGSLLQQAIAAARSSKLGHHPDSFIYSTEERFVPAHSVAVAYRREVFEKLGGFDERFDACEDVDFNHRVDKSGMRCLLAPSIRLWYHPRTSLRGLERQLARYGRGRARLFRKHPDTLSWKSFLPAAFLAFLILGGAACLASRPWTMVYAATVGVYLAVVLACSLLLTIKARDARLLAVLPGVFLAIHLGAGRGALCELLWGRTMRMRSDSTSLESGDDAPLPTE